ncbi:MAG: hypothetical protein N5P05_004566 (plasmid) [Chroococcopsis gigantea SAG 12.99]|jgi:hypothetical protein|nr:hypothetical protein [Chroococcopsis gigantea SAG 12.99]
MAILKDEELLVLPFEFQPATAFSLVGFKVIINR